MPRVCPREGTTPRSRCAATDGRCCGFSTDPEERANVECFAAAPRLPDKLSDSMQYRNARELLTFRLVDIVRKLM
jgi:hypothetical protein